MTTTPNSTSGAADQARVRARLYRAGFEQRVQDLVARLARARADRAAAVADVEDDFGAALRILLSEHDADATGPQTTGHVLAVWAHYARVWDEAWGAGSVMVEHLEASLARAVACAPAAVPVQAAAPRMSGGIPVLDELPPPSTPPVVLPPPAAAAPPLRPVPSTKPVYVVDVGRAGVARVRRPVLARLPAARPAGPGDRR